MQPEMWEQWEEAENHKKAKENKQLERSKTQQSATIFSYFFYVQYSLPHCQDRRDRWIALQSHVSWAAKSMGHGGHGPIIK